MSISWFIPAIFALFSILTGCEKEYKPNKFLLHYACGPNMTTNGVVFMSVLGKFSYGSPILMMVMYCMLFAYMRYKAATTVNEASAQNAERAKIERRMLLQGAIICAVLMAEIGSFWAVPRLTKLFWAPYVTACVRMINSTVNPVVYFIFNTQVRKEVFALFGKTIQSDRATAGGRPKIKRWATNRSTKFAGGSRQSNHVGTTQRIEKY